eukprot:gene14245-16812_t
MDVPLSPCLAHHNDNLFVVGGRDLRLQTHTQEIWVINITTKQSSNWITSDRKLWWSELRGINGNERISLV